MKGWASIPSFGKRPARCSRRPGNMPGCAFSTRPIPARRLTRSGLRPVTATQSAAGTWSRWPPRDHPNIALELAGRPPLIPGAVRLAQLHDWVKQWTTPINREDAIATLDFEWPPGSEQWYRPGPLFEARAAGMWPSQATYSVWSNWLWNACEKSVGEIPKNSIPEIGCDVVRFGDDFTDIHIRDGGVSIHHETHNGWSLDQTAGRLKQLCKQMLEHCIKKNPDFRTGLTPQEIPCKIDVDGMGAGVVDMGGGYNFIGLSGSMVLVGDYK